MRRPACLLAAVLLILGLAGCAGPGRWRADLAAQVPPRLELADVPFFPDEGNYCGPAALASGLAAAGLAASPERLAEQVFLPGRRGTLQVEMLAGARRNGAIAVPIPGRPDALLNEVAAGHPVIVLLNLGLSWVPVWHYAVVIGYDLDRDEILLHSGATQRQAMAFRTFLNTWERSERWAFVALAPGRLPATATADAVTHALLAFERTAPPAQATTAYAAAYRRWPEQAILGLGLGNALAASGDRRAAITVFRQVAEDRQLAAAYNNLAQLLLEEGDATAALRAAETGLAIAGPLRDTLLATRQAAVNAVATRPAAPPQHAP